MKINIFTLAALAISASRAISISQILESLLDIKPSIETSSRGVGSTWEDNKGLIDLHKKLVDIPSVSYKEADVTSFLKTYLVGKGFTVETIVIDEETNRANLYIYQGTKRETKIMMMSHVDTVPPFFPYKIVGNKIYGRGSVDDKASVVTQIKAFEELVANGDIDEGDVSLLLDIGEENGADGAIKANEMGIPWETVIFGEPTELTLVIGHKGIAQGILKATGKSGHSSIPELGINAIELLIDVLDELRSVTFPGGDVLGNSTLNIGLIEGGVAANVIPGEARATVSLRVASEDVEEINKIFETVLANHPAVEWEEYSLRAPVFFKHDIPGYNYSVMAGGTDAMMFKGDFEQYLIGPGGFESIHAADEHVTVEELVKGVSVYKDIILYKLK